MAFEQRPEEDGGKPYGWIIFRRAYQKERTANAKALEVESAC